MILDCISFNLSTIDWTAISAIVSFLMVFATFATVCISRKQLKEMKKQYDSERLPKLVLSVGIAQKALFLKVTNVGILPADNIQLGINKDFYEAIPKEAKDCFDTFIAPFFVDGRTTKYVYIGFASDLEELFTDKNITLEVMGTYCDKYQVDFKCSLDEIVGKRFARVVDDLTFAVEDIDKSISSAKSTANYKTIQRSLHEIANSLDKISSTIKETSAPSVSEES